MAMTKKIIKSVLLIDDDEPITFLNEFIIKRSGLVENVYVKQSGYDALEFLKTKKDQIEGGLVFLDINMPGMNGWEFLEEYKKLGKNYLENVVIIMLSTSLDPDDIQKAKSIKEINEFRSKPLTRDIFFEIHENYFEGLSNV